MDRDTLIAEMSKRWRPTMEPSAVIAVCADVALTWLDTDTATAHEEDSDALADVVAILDELDAPRVQDTHTLTPAERLGLYLDQRREAAEAEVTRLRERVEWANGALLRATQAHDVDRAELEQVRSERVQLRAKLDAVNAALDNAEVPQTVPVEGTVYGSGEAAARVRWIDKARLTAGDAAAARAAEVEKLNKDIGGLRLDLEDARASNARHRAELAERAADERRAADRIHQADAADTRRLQYERRGLVVVLAEMGHLLVARGQS